jgi:hypothetical protein
MTGSASGVDPGPIEGAAAGKTAGVPPTATEAKRLNLAYHAIIGVAIGLITPFTGFAWPIAILLGIVIGQSQVDRAMGARPSSATARRRLTPFVD